MYNTARLASAVVLVLAGQNWPGRVVVDTQINCEVSGVFASKDSSGKLPNAIKEARRGWGGKGGEIHCPHYSGGYRDWDDRNRLSFHGLIMPHVGTR